MKFEQINEKQIRCTIEPDDFQKMHMSIQDFAYGNERTRKLFREMLEQAYDELDFKTEDSPIMIEAIPLSENTVSLLITKVDDPEELDTRFARFSNIDMDDEESEDTDFSETVRSLFKRADEIIGMFSENTAKDTSIADEEPLPTAADKTDFNRIFRFSTLDHICEAARILAPQFHGRSSVYKDEKKKLYLLILHKDDHTPEEFNAICNQLSEYSDISNRDRILASYYMEHMEPLIEDRAIEVLKNL